METTRLGPHAAAVLTLAACLVWRCPASASLLLPPAVGVPDTAMNGAVVPKPLTPEGAMFQNPAGLVGFGKTTASLGLGTIFTELKVEATAPPAYEHTDNGLILVPSGGLIVPLAHGWHFGVGMHGSTGASLDFPAEEDLPSDFFTEAAVAALPLALAYELRDDLWLGAEIVPLFGYLRNRFTLIDPSGGGALPIRYTLRGPGVQAMVGATWIPTRVWSLGLGVRTPGWIWMDGSTPVAGVRRDVDLRLEMPMQVSAGTTVRATDRLEVSAALRWTDSSSFEDSEIEFAQFSFPYVPNAKDEWRPSLAIAFEATPTLVLRAGASYASRIVGNHGVSPLLFDTEDIKASGGFSWRRDHWTWDTMVGYSFTGEREVPPGEALILPGSYRAGGTIVMLGFRYER